jgi:hypothetical protein
MSDLKNEWTETIAALADENRKLREARKKDGDTPPSRAEMDWGPVWDAQIDLTTFVGIIGAVIYLVKPDDDDDQAKEEILAALIAVQEHISDLADGLGGAIKGMKLLKETAA